MNRSSKLAVGWLITIYFLYVTLEKLDFKQAIAGLSSVNLSWILLAVIVLMLDYLVRIIRWWFMFKSTVFKPPFWICARFFLVGNALNNFLPLRAGDMYRIIQFSEKTRIPSGTVLATVAVERIFDICALMTLLFVGISGEVGALIFSGFPIEVQQAIKLFAATCFLGAILLLFLPTPIKKIIEIINKNIPLPKILFNFLMDTILAIQNLLSPYRVLVLMLSSLLAWFLESLAYGAVQASLNLELPINAMLISNTFATISTLFPSSPGYVGTFHYFATLSLLPFGVPLQAATTFALVMHALLWICISLFGIIAYISTSSLVLNQAKVS